MPFLTKYKLIDLLHEDNADGVQVLCSVLEHFETMRGIRPNADVVAYYKNQQKQVLINAGAETRAHWRFAHYLSFVTKKLHKSYIKLYPEIVTLDLVKVQAILAKKINKILIILYKKKLLQGMEKEELLTLLVRVFLGDPAQHGKRTKLRKEVASLLD